MAAAGDRLWGHPQVSEGESAGSPGKAGRPKLGIWQALAIAVFDIFVMRLDSDLVIGIDLKVLTRLEIAAQSLSVCVQVYRHFILTEMYNLYSIHTCDILKLSVYILADMFHCGHALLLGSVL